MCSLLIPIVSVVGTAKGRPITIFVQRSMGNRYPLAQIFSAGVLASAPSAVLSRFGGAFAGSCGRAAQVVGLGYGLAGMWRFPEEEEGALGNHSTQNPASA